MAARAVSSRALVNQLDSNTENGGGEEAGGKHKSGDELGGINKKKMEEVEREKTARSLNGVRVGDKVCCRSGGPKA